MSQLQFQGVLSSLNFTQLITPQNHFPRSLCSMGSLGKCTAVPGPTRNSSDNNQVLPAPTRSTRWSSKQDSMCSPSKYQEMSWKPRARSGTTSNLFPQVHQGLSKQCSQTQSNQLYRQAIWLHQHYIEHRRQLRGRTLLPVLKVPLV